LPCFWEEYEGLCGGYRIVDGKIFDGDGDEIGYRRTDDFIPGSWVAGQCTMKEAYGDGPLKSLAEQLEMDRIEEEREIREMKEREKMARAEIWSLEHKRIIECVKEGRPVSRGPVVEALMNPQGIAATGQNRKLLEKQQAQADAQALECMTAKEEAVSLLTKLQKRHEAIVELRLDGRDPDLSLRRQRDKEREQSGEGGTAVTPTALRKKAKKAAAVVETGFKDPSCKQCTQPSLKTRHTCIKAKDRV